MTAIISFDDSNFPLRLNSAASYFIILKDRKELINVNKDPQHLKKKHEKYCFKI